jgi:hypothetical protein
MRFSKPFIVLACTLLLLVGAALGYSAKLFWQMAGVDDELKLIDYDLRGLEYRIFILESQQLRMEPPEKAIYANHGLDRVDRKGQPRSLRVSKPSGRK